MISARRLASVRLRNPRAFSLLEVLAAMAILAVLGGLSVGWIQNSLQQAERAKELQAGRTLITAYLLAASENSGRLPAGYDRSTSVVEWPDGTSVHGPTANRYPFRLGPYYDHKLNGVILVNKNASQIDPTDTYSVSVSPAFGINYLYVGGDLAADGSASLPASETISSLANTQNIIAFATAGSQENAGSITHGFNILTPPKIYTDMWVGENWSEGANPANHGHVHPRHNNQVLCVFLDGSARLKSTEELRDMRLWNPVAAASNNPNYVVPAAPRPPRGRR
jgi:prepilin-type N-terminal cleavage/methylation domain-containing protein